MGLPTETRRDDRSAAAAEYRKWYKTAAWRRIRTERLSIEPLCRMCTSAGNVTPASIVDHVKPHKGDFDLFFDIKNTQSLCSHHHNKWKQASERSTAQPIGQDGWPLAAED